MKRSTCTLAAVGLALIVGAIAPAAGGRGAAKGAAKPKKPHPVMPQNKVPGAVESTARRLTNGLRHDGYEVGRGYLKLYTSDDCDVSYEIMGSCYGNNPAAPYVLPVVPSWPDEWVDPATVGAFGDTVDGYSGSYRFDPREAIVVLGLLPPPADYVGLQTYLFTRPGEWNDQSEQYTWIFDHAKNTLPMFFSKVPNNQARLQLFANVTESNNNVVIADRSNTVWDQVRYFVITPDRTMDHVIRDAFAQIGIADHDIFTEAIPGDMHIGLDSASDDFISLMRYAMPVDGGGDRTRSEKWRQQLPLVVLRVRDHGGIPETYPPVTFEPRTPTQPPETSLASDLITLAKAVCQNWGQPCDLSGKAFEDAVPQLMNLPIAHTYLTGPKCIEVGMNCLAPTEDSTYFMSGKLPLPDDRVWAIVGPVGTRTNAATYVGLGLNASLKQWAFDNIPDERLEGTADDYTAAPNHDKFFVQYFARDCSDIGTWVGNSHCYSIGDKLQSSCMDPANLSCDMLVLSLRGYIRPTTQRGADPWQALNPRLIPLWKP